MQKSKETGRQTQSKIVRVILNAPKQSMKMLFYVQLVCVSFHCENTSNYGDLFPLLLRSPVPNNNNTARCMWCWCLSCLSDLTQQSAMRQKSREGGRRWAAVKDISFSLICRCMWMQMYTWGGLRWRSGSAVYHRVGNWACTNCFQWAGLFSTSQA